jgi:hypothetical protein
MVKSLTVAQVKKMTGRETLYVIGWYNADGTPQEYRQNGAIKLWKTRPDDFRIPVKRGLYEYAAITPDNAHMVSLERPPSVPKNTVYKGQSGRVR